MEHGQEGEMMDRPKGGEWQQFISDWQAAKSKKSFAA